MLSPKTKTPRVNRGDGEALLAGGRGAAKFASAGTAGGDGLGCVAIVGVLPVVVARFGREGTLGLRPLVDCAKADPDVFSATGSSPPRLIAKDPRIGLEGFEGKTSEPCDGCGAEMNDISSACTASRKNNILPRWSCILKS